MRNGLVMPAQLQGDLGNRFFIHGFYKPAKMCITSANAKIKGVTANAVNALLKAFLALRCLGFWLGSW